jgi:glycerophosphoryl diester phosphodiesterase
VTSRARRICTAVMVGAALVATAAPAAAAHDWGGEEDPLVIGHRGASGYLPEHTLQSYALAIKLGADYVEPDLVATKDGHLIARHEPNIADTTDVRAKFPGRETTEIVDGVPTTGFFASDFTLEEIKTLRAVQTFPERPQRFNGRFKIPTLQEVIDLVKRESRKRHRRIGIYPETKHPTYHEDLGLPLEPRLVKILKHAGWDSRRDPVFIQSFEQSNLKRLNRMIGVRLVQLVDANDVLADGSLEYVAPFDRPYDWTVSGDPELEARTFGFFATDEGLEEISEYADGIGPWKRYIVSTLGTGPESSRTLAPPTDLIDRAHEHGLQIHTWTFRNEQSRLVSNYGGNPINEYLQFYELGIDGVFSDFPDTAFTARELLRVE